VRLKSSRPSRLGGPWGERQRSPRAHHMHPGRRNGATPKAWRSEAQVIPSIPSNDKPGAGSAEWTRDATSPAARRRETPSPRKTGSRSVCCRWPAYGCTGRPDLRPNRPRRFYRFAATSVDYPYNVFPLLPAPSVSGGTRRAPPELFAVRPHRITVLDRGVKKAGVAESRHGDPMFTYS
jgi:hypothetical protein